MIKFTFFARSIIIYIIIQQGGAICLLENLHIYMSGQSGMACNACNGNNWWQVLSVKLEKRFGKKKKRNVTIDRCKTCAMFNKESVNLNEALRLFR